MVKFTVYLLFCLWLSNLANAFQTTRIALGANKHGHCSSSSICWMALMEDGSGGKSRRDVLTSVGTAAAMTALATTQGLLGSPSVVQAAEQVAIPTVAVAVAATSTAALTSAGRIQLPPMGLGAWAWGDSLFWGYDQKNDEELRKVFDYAIQNSKSSTTLLDTAEVYGLGRSEKLSKSCGYEWDVFTRNKGAA